MIRRVICLVTTLFVLAGMLVTAPTRAEAAAWAAPGKPSVVSRSAKAVAVSWKAVWGAPRYLVKYATKKSFASAKTVRTTEPYAELTGLKPGRRYYVKVAVARTTGTKLSKYGKTGQVTTRTARTALPRLAPAGLRLHARGKNTLTVSWRGRAGATHYQVRYATNGRFAKARHATVKATGLRLTRLKKGTRYWVQVRTRTAKGKATSSFGKAIRVSTTTGVSYAPLRAATYNILCANCSESHPWAKRRGALVKAIKAQDLDVLGAQEASQGLTKGADGRRKAQFADLLALLGSRYRLTNTYRYNCKKSTTPTKCKVKQRGASNATRIFYNRTRVKLLRQGSTQFRAQDPTRTKRFVVWAEFRQLSTGKRFFVVNTHLDPVNDASGASFHHKVRAAQARELVAAIKQRNRSRLPVVILGDFKTSKYTKPSNAPYDVVTRAGYRDPLGNTYKSKTPSRSAIVERRLGTEFNTKNNLKAAPPKSAYINGSVIDYVFVSPKIRVAEWQTVVHLAGSGRFAAKPPSDHNMVRVSLYLP